MEAVTVERKATKPPKAVTEQRMATMRRLLEQDGGTTTKELIAACGITKQAVSQNLQKLGAFRRDGRWYLDAARSIEESGE